MANGFNWKLEDDYETVTITFPTEPPTALKLDAKGVEEILKNLGEFRSHMKPEIAKDYALRQKVSAVPDPKWVSEPDALVGNSLLHIRDPRFGWLHYIIPREEARKLAGYLQNQANYPPLDKDQVRQTSRPSKAT